MTLFDNLGGVCLGKIVDKFYELVCADPKLAYHFQEFDVSKVNKGQRTFLTMMFGGPKNYHGRDMKTVHQGLNITSAQFDQSWLYMQQALIAAKVKQPLCEEVKNIFYSFKDEVVTVQK